MASMSTSSASFALLVEHELFAPANTVDMHAFSDETVFIAFEELQDEPASAELAKNANATSMSADTFRVRTVSILLDEL